MLKPSDGLEPSTPYGENAGGVRPRVGPRASGRAGGPTWRVGVSGRYWFRRRVGG
jgi:hypothetical protein